jgi:hypothetical protein
MVPDAEILRIVSEVFEELGWTGRYTRLMLRTSGFMASQRANGTVRS